MILFAWILNFVGKNTNDWTVEENHVLKSIRLIYLLQYLLNAY